MKRLHVKRKLKIIVPVIAATVLISGSAFTYAYLQNAKSVAATSEQADMRAAQASVQLVTDFYTQYMAVTSYAQADYEQAITHYGTPALLAFYRAHQDGTDPITCAPFAPDSIKVSGTKDTVKVDATYSDDTTQHGITVDMATKGGLKIDTITCPQ